MELLEDETIRALIPDELVRAHRERALRPDNPFIRGTAQNPDVYFQGREAVNPFYDRVADIVEAHFGKLGALTGRHYKIVEYYGAPDADRVVIALGSGVETLAETADYLQQQGEKVGVLQIRLYRPLSAKHLLAALPATVRRIAVLDRTKEAGSNGEPLFQDILTALVDNQDNLEYLPRLIGGRYGLSSKSSHRPWRRPCSTN